MSKPYSQPVTITEYSQKALDELKEAVYRGTLKAMRMSKYIDSLPKSERNAVLTRELGEDWERLILP